MILKMKKGARHDGLMKQALIPVISQPHVISADYISATP
jgi:hypothetical protein